MRAILYASCPADAKKAIAAILDFRGEAWNNVSVRAMWMAQLLRCSDKAAFKMFQGILKTARADGAVKRFLAVEANGYDELWGVGLFTQPLIDAIVAATPTNSLIADAKAAFKGKNQLGDIITYFLLAIEGMTY